MNTDTLIDQASEALDFSALLCLSLPLAFPLVAWIDGAGDAYARFSILAMCLSVFAAGLLMVALTVLSSCLSGIVSNRIERERDTRAFHEYLLNGGKA